MKKSSIHQSWQEQSENSGGKGRQEKSGIKTIPMGQGERRGTP